jgi:hypothetical protein
LWYVMAWMIDDDDNDDDGGGVVNYEAVDD